MDRTDAPRHPLWAYDLLRPGPRRVRALRTPGPAPLGGTGPFLVLASRSATGLLAVAAQAFATRAPWAPLPFRVPVDLAARRPGPADVSIEGIALESPRRPAIETVPGPGDEAGSILLLRRSACDGCGDCVPACPASCLSLEGGRLRIDESPCISCMACVEACPTGALAPVAGPAPTVMAPDASRPRGFLARMSPDQRAPAADERAPAWQAEREGLPPTRPESASPRGAGKPTYVLGLAVATMQENGAALLKDGVLVGAVEEERLSRRKHHGFRQPGRPYRTICNDLSAAIEDAFAWRSVRFLLEREGIALDDVDAIAVNGIPGRFRRSYSLDDAGRPPVTLKSGRMVFVPHHLAHAASTYYFGGGPDAHVLTVDGRGDRETAAFFRGQDGRLERVFDVLSLQDQSIGGVYETVSRILGFGPHGQGSTMALAVMGQPRFDLSAALSVQSRDRFTIRENEPMRLYGHLRRGRFDPLTDDHRDLAASVQQALEDAVVALIEDGRGGEPVRNLCLAGGVALNCQMNTRLEHHFRPASMFVQPAAHDGGTAIGAALIAHLELTGHAPFQPLRHACWGPEPLDAEVRAALDAFGLPARRVADVPAEVGERVAAGQVIAWVQGGLEIGPRALGARSLVAHPGLWDFHPRLNAAKGREPWRPFAPSILAGTEADWFTDPNGNGFMLFVANVRPDRKEAVAAIVHTDGTTRPQSVHADAQPRYHAMITEFHRRTGIPLVLNTSFNTADEPIATSPRDCLNSFLQVGADALAIGDWIVERPGNPRVPGADLRLPRPPDPPPREPPLAPGDGRAFRRLLLRLGARCNSACAHCTIRDIAHLPERDTEGALAALRTGRERGCTEVVFLRGEPLIRKDVARLAREARAMGYEHVQVQTNGRMLAYPGLPRLLALKGVTFFEVSLYGDRAQVHDDIARSPGAFDQTIAGIRALVAEGLPFLVNVPVLAANGQHLDGMMRLLADLGATRVQMGLTRPVWIESDGRLDVIPTVRISRVAGHLRTALRTARSLGLDARTEGVVLCHLDPDLWDAAELPGEVDAQLVAELDGLRPAGAIRAESRPKPDACTRCRVADRCPGPWAGSTLLFGDSELDPI